MKDELKQLKEGNASQCFQSFVERYVNKIKVPIGSRASIGTNKIDESKINSADKRTKIEYLLRKLSKYESLAAFYKNNQVLVDKCKAQRFNGKIDS